MFIITVNRVVMLGMNGVFLINSSRTLLTK